VKILDETPMREDWLSLGDVAKLLGVHPSTVRSWANSGHLPVHRTQGGHRRFRRADVEMWQVARPAEQSLPLDLMAQTALRRTRLEISGGKLETESWYQKLDDASRDQYRQSGRSLLLGLINYLSTKDANKQAEARSLGYEYASRGQRCGLNSVEAVNAFLFFRNLLMDSLLSFYEEAGINSPQVWAEMIRRSQEFTDLIMLTLLETYDAYQRAVR
jgi:excisionase family DNA binding protein